jgi:hypothetical protein
MAWEIIIGDGGTAVTIDSDASFQISTLQNMKEDGSAQFFDTTINLVGSVVAATPSLVADGIVTLRQLAREGSPVRIRLRQDGTDKWDFQPADFLGTPKVAEFLTIPDDGAGENHWPFQMRIFMREGLIEGQGGSGGNQVGTVRMTMTEKFHKAYVRKIWRISQTGTNLAAMKAFIQARKPPVRPLRELLTVDAQNNQVAAEWIWEASDGTVIEFVESQPLIRVGGDRYVIDKRVDGADPVAHLARRDAATVKFSGIIRVVHRDDGSAPEVKPPNRHLQPGPSIVPSADDASTLGPPVCVDRKNGVFEIIWEENYLLLGDVQNALPSVDHGDHNKPFALKEPADGAFFN